ncbi:uncharacterized protein SPAPADRAFT_68339 [Spathaspora passalidarum NRRL Y-27907]|uniref:AMP-dependent synthetase/ligase domain-containing protein n=1 Tax=Spathaspora passalidarum (strain NRRL Y-27907 / 11-Y1) TaxID=619300 RepID=G3AST1_SPAPN|nr:uncharacterized protein SPAPADRAFT_68339 [Spathaspora passalidarum NRRL Y-27907]EGW31144.1 hypothetical protein SPAPADRAFT_68339 [Spathaspora passalidarum NRRL Y-27907]
MELETILLVYILIPLLLIHLFTTSHYFKDVPDLYLAEQSEIDATRHVNESPIYRSNKLEMGLRVGLGIRYDSYKLRAGNLRDIWSVKSLQFGDEVVINDIRFKWAEINYMVDKISKQLKGVKVVRIPLEHRIDIKWVIVLIAGFINQITVEFYDVGEGEGANIDDIDTTGEGELYEYKNQYSSEKDKGISLRIVRHNQGAIEKSTIEFTQLNIVCAVASTIKHLPASQEIGKDDTMVIVPSKNISNEELLNVITKFLTCLVTHAKLVIAGNPDDITKYNPTILSIHEDNLPTPQANYLSYINKAIISRGKLLPGQLRIIYINNRITSCKYTAKQLSHLRGIYSARIIRESGYYNIIGPLILTDFYDYRTFAKFSYGCISQSVEMKIVATNEQNIGLLSVRGYVIGKTTNIMKDKHHNSNSSTMHENEGFMPVNVRCKWGSDGCLYVI